jgi:hypothetical protein
VTNRNAPSRQASSPTLIAEREMPDDVEIGVKDLEDAL